MSQRYGPPSFGPPGRGPPGHGPPGYGPPGYGPPSYGPPGYGPGPGYGPPGQGPGHCPPGQEPPGQGSGIRLRQDLRDLEAQYKRGNKVPLERLVRAFKGIQEYPSSNPKSFHRIGSLHGAPFRGAGRLDSAYWGGYCFHGQVLFPIWHRAYIREIEDALRTIEPEVTLPYWDETDADSLKAGIPWSLSAPTFMLDGKEIPNPLRSYTLREEVLDTTKDPPPNAPPGSPASFAYDYSKPKGYSTVRYPLSGLVGTEADRIATQAHNSKFPNPEVQNDLLNKNLVSWLNGPMNKRGAINEHVWECLNTPDFAAFSNDTSIAEWNRNLPPGQVHSSLERPHNDMHLALGGFTVVRPGDGGNLVGGANGDMASNETAGFDPVFYFHHCYIDYVFWKWQERHGQTTSLTIPVDYPGTNSSDGGGPPVGVPPNARLSLDTPLEPFLNTDGTYVTGHDVVDLRKTGVEYAPGSLDREPVIPRPVVRSSKTLVVEGINRGLIHGSFVIEVFGKVNGKRELIEEQAVLSRNHVSGCANCQSHLTTSYFFAIPDDVDENSIEVELETHDAEYLVVLSKEISGHARPALRTANIRIVK